MSLGGATRFVAYAKRVWGEETARVLVHVGANVQAWRLRRGLSQAQLAEMVEREASYLQKIEYSTAVPNIPTLVRLAKTLDVEIWKLLKPRKAPVRRTGRPKRGSPKPGMRRSH